MKKLNLNLLPASKIRNLILFLENPKPQNFSAVERNQETESSCNLIIKLHTKEEKYKTKVFSQTFPTS